MEIVGLPDADNGVFSRRRMAQILNDDLSNEALSKFLAAKYHRHRWVVELVLGWQRDRPFVDEEGDEWEIDPTASEGEQFRDYSGRMFATSDVPDDDLDPGYIACALHAVALGDPRAWSSVCITFAEELEQHTLVVMIASRVAQNSALRDAADDLLHTLATTRELKRYTQLVPFAEDLAEDGSRGAWEFLLRWNRARRDFRAARYWEHRLGERGGRHEHPGRIRLESLLAQMSEVDLHLDDFVFNELALRQTGNPDRLVMSDEEDLMAKNRLLREQNMSLEASVRRLRKRLDSRAQDR